MLAFTIRILSRQLIKQRTIPSPTIYTFIYPGELTLFRSQQCIIIITTSLLSSTIVKKCSCTVKNMHYFTQHRLNDMQM